MSSGEENNRIENAARGAYDGKMDVRFVAIETRIAAVEVDLAVIRTSFATKDDMQRIMTILYEQKLEFSNGFANQRGEFHSALAKQREDFTSALTQQNERLTAALTQQNEKLTAALTQQSQRFDAALAKQRDDLNKTLMTHIWKFYGFAVVLMSGVYYIARYVH